MARYHLGRSGHPTKCAAQPGNCPLGGDEDHFGSKEEFYSKFEAEMAEQTLESFSKKKPSPRTMLSPREWEKLSKLPDQGIIPAIEKLHGKEAAEAIHFELGLRKEGLAGADLDMGPYKTNNWAGVNGSSFAVSETTSPEEMSKHLDTFQAGDYMKITDRQGNSYVTKVKGKAKVDGYTRLNAGYSEVNGAGTISPANGDDQYMWQSRTASIERVEYTGPNKVQHSGQIASLAPEADDDINELRSKLQRANGRATLESTTEDFMANTNTIFALETEIARRSNGVTYTPYNPKGTSIIGEPDKQVKYDIYRGPVSAAAKQLNASQPSQPILMDEFWDKPREVIRDNRAA